MATFYVRKTGNDGNAGTSAGAAWLTLGKALGASGISSGDTVYVGSGIYRETVTVAMTSATVETQVIADVDGSKTGDAGQVIWTARTTNDTTAPAASPTLTLAARDFLTFRNFYIEGGSPGSGNLCVDASTAASTDIKFDGCVFLAGALGGNLIRCVGSAATALNWTIQNCSFLVYNGGTGLYLTIPTSGGGSDYDVNFVVQNCFAMGTNALGVFYVDTSGALANKGGGVVYLNNTVIGGGQAFSFASSSLSTSITCKIYNCIMVAQTTGMSSNAASQVVEDFNLIQATTARTNITAGASSIASFATATRLDMGYSAIAGLLQRNWWTPTASSPILGFGNKPSSPSPPATDITSRPRPAGGGSTSNAIGVSERHDTAAKETSVTDSGSTSCKIIGPGDHDLFIPVDAAATTITIRARFDTNHGAGSKPQAILLASPDIGVTASTATVTAAVDTWQTLTLGPFTPTAKGWVTLRMVSRAAAGNGVAFFDTLTVT